MKPLVCGYCGYKTEELTEYKDNRPFNKVIRCTNPDCKMLIVRKYVQEKK